ncbi:haloacetate dehalogenase [Burkholderiales bacterium]|nr:haloacetate dehalogenase [Burkholderiales bacterium]
MNRDATLFPGFRSMRVDGEGATIACVVGGSGPPLLMLHGYPQTHAMWHRVAPALAGTHTVVCADLRGYGDSSKPPSDASHAPYSKRAMAADMVAVMRELGHRRFRLVGHDRGGRVAHRLCVDHPDAVERAAVLDIAPTLAMYEKTDRRFATAYYHWFFLIQPFDLPERMIGADPASYLLTKIGGWGSSGTLFFAADALAEYQRSFGDPATIHATCEDYRASASIDLEHDAADRAAGVRVRCPLLVLWGGRGVVHRLFDPLAEWRAVADDVSGGALACGHYLAEEAPDETRAELARFLAQGR